MRHAHSGLDVRLFVKNQVQQGSMNFNMAVIVDEAQRSKPVHEKAHA
jgi:hypothetical protein